MERKTIEELMDKLGVRLYDSSGNIRMSDDVLLDIINSLRLSKETMHKSDFMLFLDEVILILLYGN